MAQAQMAPIYCNECNGRFDSEDELWNHTNTAHHMFASELRTFQHVGTEPCSIEDQLDASQEGWAKLSAQLRNRVQVHFNPEELDAIDRFILLASQG